MNPFLIMMASAKENAAMKKPVPIAPKVVQKGKLGRPPAPKTEKILIAVACCCRHEKYDR